MMDQDTGIDMVALTAQIVAAHVSNATVAADALPKLIGEVFRALSEVGEPPAAAPSVPDRPQPAVPVKRSVYPDYIVCLEDGKRLKMLKRHLKTAYGMTPDAYRQRWGLPSDYPMVAPSYASQRSALARRIGLGRKPAGPD